MKLRAAAKRLRKLAGAVLIGADGITPVRADRTDEPADTRTTNGGAR